MILHGIAHHILHLVEASVIHRLHRMEYTALHGLEAVGYMRHGTLEYHIRGIVEKPALVHASQLMFHNTVGCVDRHA